MKEEVYQSYIHTKKISTIAFVLTSVQDLRDSDKPKTKT